jgi:hypothetical protein
VCHADTAFNSSTIFCVQNCTTERTFQSARDITHRERERERETALNNSSNQAVARVAVSSPRKRRSDEKHSDKYSPVVVARLAFTGADGFLWLLPGITASTQNSHYVIPSLDCVTTRIMGPAHVSEVQILNLTVFFKNIISSLQ